MVYHPRRTLDLPVDTGKLFLQVLDLCIAVAQTLEHVRHGHAHDVQRLVDFVGQPRGHFAKGGHFRTVGQLLLRATHLGVVAANGLYFQQVALFVENPPVRPHPPGIFATRQLQADFSGAYRRLWSQTRNTLHKGFTLFVGQPTAQVDARQLLGRALQVAGQRLVAKGQGQVGQVTADHGG